MFDDVKRGFGTLPDMDDVALLEMGQGSTDLAAEESGSDFSAFDITPIESQVRFDETDNLTSQGGARIDPNLESMKTSAKLALISQRPKQVISTIQHVGASFGKDYLRDSKFLGFFTPLFKLSGILGPVFVPCSLFGECQKTASELARVKVHPAMVLKNAKCADCPQNRNNYCAVIQTKLADKVEVEQEISKKVASLALNFPVATFGSFRDQVLSSKISSVKKLQKFMFTDPVKVKGMPDFNPTPSENTGFDSAVASTDEDEKVTAKAAIASIVRNISLADKVDPKKLAWDVSQVGPKVSGNLKEKFASYSKLMSFLLENLKGFGVKASWMKCPIKLGTIASLFGLSSDAVNSSKLQANIKIVPASKCERCSYATHQGCQAHGIGFSTRVKQVPVETQVVKDEMRDKVVESASKLSAQAETPEVSPNQDADPFAFKIDDPNRGL